jgi:hypothetical protein
MPEIESTNCSPPCLREMGGDPGGDEVELVNQLVAACEIDALQSEVRSSLELDAVVTFLSGTRHPSLEARGLERGASWRSTETATATETTRWMIRFQGGV